jgi:hypothetical protein
MASLSARAGRISCMQLAEQLRVGPIMGVLIAIRLDDDVRHELEARARGIGVATLLRDLATTAAREARRSRIREASAAVGGKVAASTEGEAFYQDWGTPRADAG